MAKVKYSTLKLKINTETKAIQIGDKEVLVKQYLPSEQKLVIINNAVKSSNLYGYVDEIALDVYLHISIIEMYSNIDFSGRTLSDVFNTFDELNSNGIIDLIISAIPNEEYDYIFKMAGVNKQNLNAYNRSIPGSSGQAEETLKALSELVQQNIDKESNKN